MNNAHKSLAFEERTVKFSEDILFFCRNIKETNITKPLLSQVIRSATSIGANYCEANNASSKKDFKNKIFICKKESQETKYWLRLLAASLPAKKAPLRKLYQECHELNMIFQKIISTMNKNDNLKNVN
jgi:four helix bundle protein